MFDSETPRLSRLTAIITFLQTKRLVTSTELAKKFDVSVRTIYRDIRALELSGIPICTEEGKGYSLVEGFALAPVMFTETEANALITAEQLVLKNSDTSFIKNYQDALLKVKAVLRTNTKEKARILAERIVYRTNATQNSPSHYLSIIQLALTSFSLIRITYVSQEGNTSQRIIEPFALYNTQENWVLIAWCRLRKENRSFRLDRIQELETLTESFQPQNITLQEYFDEVRKKYFGTPDIPLS
jgi:predicted DNA-binding transcriptional regulator YafY